MRLYLVSSAWGSQQNVVVKRSVADASSRPSYESALRLSGSGISGANARFFLAGGPCPSTNGRRGAPLVDAQALAADVSPRFRSSRRCRNALSLSSGRLQFDRVA